ncbi:hypothetical protein AB0K48_52565, partial [Nonomuraea sp. NPDC055795]
MEVRVGEVVGLGDSSPGPSWGIVVMLVEGTGQSRLAAFPRLRPAGFTQSSSSGGSGRNVPGGGLPEEWRWDDGVGTALGLRVRVSVTAGLDGGVVTGAGTPLAGPVVGRTVEPADPCGCTIGISGMTELPEKPRPPWFPAATTVIAAMETVARAAKLAWDKWAPA